MRLDYLSGGGPVPEDSPLYVERSADSDLFDSIQAGELPYVCNARQMGKTSLWGRTQKKLFEHDDSSCSVLIDINSFTPSKNYEARKWYYSFIDLLNYELKILNDDGLSHFFSKADQFLPRYSLTIFFQYLRKRSRYQRIIIGIDEIDQVLLFPRDIGIDFFKSIRACYQDNISNNSSQSRDTQIGFVLIGVAAPNDLDRNLRDDIKGTPFNLGVPIDLTGISTDKAIPVLSPGLEGLVSSPGAAIDHIVKLTGGQPFLTQKACHLIKMAARRDTSVAEKSVEELTSWTTDVIEQQIIETAWIKDHGVHFRPIEDAIINDTPVSKESQSGRLLELYERLFNGESVEDDGIHCIRLCLSGLTYSENGYLYIRSEIYRKVFDRNWIDRQISDLRERSGYLAALRVWDEHDEGDLYLLTGEVLDDILKNITISNLPDKDQRFLILSQTQARNTAAMQEAEARARLEVIEKRKQNAQRLLWGVSSLTVGAFVVTGILGNRANIALNKAAEATQSLKETQAELDSAELELVEIRGERDHLESEVTRLDEQRKNLEGLLDAAQSEIDGTKNELAEEQERLRIANLDLDTAIYETQTAKNEAAIAKIETASAEEKRKIAQQITELERISRLALEKYEYDPVGSLKVALSAGIELQNIVKTYSIKGLENYPSVSPLYVLQQIISEIWQPSTIIQNPEKGWIDVAFSPDGQQISAISQEGVARTWNINKQELFAFQINEESQLKDLVYGANGWHYASINDEIIQIWNAKGEEISAFAVNDRIEEVIFSPDGQKIVTTSRSADRLWSFEGEEIAVLRDVGHSSKIAFSPDGKKIAIKFSDNTNYENKRVIRVVDAVGQELITQEVGLKHIDDIIFSPDSQRLFITLLNGSIEVRDLDLNIHGQRINAAIYGPPTYLKGIVFSSDGQRVSTRSENGIIRVWDSNFKQLAALQSAYMQYFALSPDGSRLVTLSPESRDVRIWELDENKLFDSEPLSFWDDARVTMSPDGQKVIIRSVKNNGYLVSDINGQQLAVIPGEDFPQGTTAFSVDSKIIAISGTDFTTRLVDLSGQELLSVDGVDPQTGITAFSPDGRFFANPTINGTARIWDFSGNEVGFFENNGINITAIAFSPDSQRIVVGDRSGKIRILNLQGEVIVERLIINKDDEPSGLIGEIVFSPDGQRFVITASKTNPKIFDLNGNELAALEAYETSIYKVIFSPDSQLIATTSYHDSSARVWDLEGRELAILQGHRDTIRSVMFSPDGQRIATVGNDNTNRIWDLNGREIAVIRRYEGELANFFFTSNGQQAGIVDADGGVRYTEIDSLETLLYRGCQWLQSYLPDDEGISNSDQQACGVVASHFAGDEQVIQIHPESQVIPVSSSSPKFSTLSVALYDEPKSYRQGISKHQTQV